MPDLVPLGRGDDGTGRRWRICDCGPDNGAAPVVVTLFGRKTLGTDLLENQPVGPPGSEWVDAGLGRKFGKI